MNRKRLFQIICFVMVPLLALLLADEIWAVPQLKAATREESILTSAIISHEHFDGNTINSTMTNDGMIVDYRLTGASGMEWPKGTGKTIDFSSGLWLAGIGHDDGNFYTACVEYTSELVPGPFTLAPGEAQFVIGAKIIAQGTDNLNSITALCSSDVFVQDFYNSNLFPMDVEPADDLGVLPAHYILSQNYPNPFNPQTTIRFYIPQAGSVSLRIYNVTGQLIRVLTDSYREAGSYEVPWDGRDYRGQEVVSGVYLCRMKSGPCDKTIKMTVLK